MIIKRTINGTEVEIELTRDEIEKAFRQKEFEYHAEDVSSYYETMYDGACPYDEEEMKSVMEHVNHVMEHNDGYWDYYWYCFEAGIKEWEENK